MPYNARLLHRLFTGNGIRRQPGFRKLTVDSFKPIAAYKIEFWKLAPSAPCYEVFFGEPGCAERIKLSRNTAMILDIKQHAIKLEPLSEQAVGKDTASYPIIKIDFADGQYLHLKMGETSAMFCDVEGEVIGGVYGNFTGIVLIPRQGGLVENAADIVVFKNGMLHNFIEARHSGKSIFDEPYIAFMNSVAKNGLCDTVLEEEFIALHSPGAADMSMQLEDSLVSAGFHFVPEPTLDSPRATCDQAAQRFK